MKRILIVLLLGLGSFVSNGQIITTIAGGGTTLGDGGPATAASLPYPYAGSFDGKGNYYFAESAGSPRARMIDTAGIIYTVAGSGVAGFSGDSGLATAAQLSSSFGVTVDGTGNIYIADWHNNRVRKVDKATGIIHTIAGNGTATVTGDGGPATAATTIPSDIYVDAPGNIYIFDSGVWVRKIDTFGIITKIAGNGLRGFSGDGGAATSAAIQTSYGLRFDASGSLIIGCSTRIRKVNTSTGIITTIAGAGLGTYTGDGGYADTANFYVYGICLDVLGEIYIADHNSAIRKIDTSGIIHTVAGNGVGGYSGDGGPADSAEIYGPEGIAIDTCGNLYIADDGNNRIRKVILDSSCGHTVIDTSLSTTLLPANSAVSIYPNPVDDILHIERVSARSNFSIVSIVGAVLLQGDLQPGANSVFVQALQPGIYMLVVYSGRGERIVRKIVKD